MVGQVDHWYDPSAFALQGAGVIGNLGRNTLLGPRFFDFDLSFSKTTRIKENMTVEFRAEAFNLLNHPNFGLPGALLFSGIDGSGNGIPSPTAGQITNTVSTQREVQFAVKFRF